MTIRIDTKDAIQKLLAFIAVRGKGRFEIPQELLDEMYASLRQLAEKNKVRITLVQPDASKVELCSWGGAAAGGAIGYWIASLPGALTGAVVGYGIGKALEHVTITVTPKDNGEAMILELL
ncbi:hypothetical protein [Geopseudomonas aromaticivorans]